MSAGVGSVGGQLVIFAVSPYLGRQPHEAPILGQQTDHTEISRPHRWHLTSLLSVQKITIPKRIAQTLKRNGGSGLELGAILALLAKPETCQEGVPFLLIFGLVIGSTHTDRHGNLPKRDAGIVTGPSLQFLLISSGGRDGLSIHRY